MKPVTAAVLVDRDGVLNERAPEHEYVTGISEFRWLAGAADAIARLSRAGCPVAVVSNQRGVARGMVTREALDEIDELIRRDLAARGGSIAAIHYCMHDLDCCDCRKPAPGLLRAAADGLGASLEASLMIGDQETDVDAGRAAGCVTARLIAESGAETRADIVAADLPQLVDRLLGRDLPPVLLARLRPLLVGEGRVMPA